MSFTALFNPKINEKRIIAAALIFYFPPAHNGLLYALEENKKLLI
jgi:hypothetical protein